MRIKTVSAANFKGRNFTYQLAPVTVITGINFAGKTAVLQAIELACTRKVAGIGARPGDLFERLGGVGDLMAKAEADDGTTWLYSLQKIKGKLIAGGVEQVGRCVVPSILFDSSEFLELSGKEKVKHLFRELAPPDLSKVGPPAIIANLKNWKVEPHTEAHEKAVDGLCEWVRTAWGFGPGQETVQELLAVLAELVRVKANDAVAAAKRMRETVLGVAQLKAPDPASLSGAEAAVGRARVALEAAQGELAAARERYAAKKRQVGEARKLADSWCAPEAGAKERLEAKAAELKPKAEYVIGEKPVMTLPDITPLSMAYNKAERKKAEALTEAMGVEKAVADLEAIIEKAKHATVCATCGQDTTEITKKVIAGHKATLKQLHAVLLKVTEKLAGCVNVKNAAKEMLDKSMVELDSAKATMADAEAGWLKWFTDKTNATNLLRITEGQLQALKDAEAKAEPARLAGKTLPIMEAELAQLGTDGAAIATREGELKVKMLEADAMHRKVVAEAGEAATQAKAAARADEAQAEAEATKALASFLQDLLALCVEQSVKPFVDSCNALCGGVLTAPLAFKDGDLGMERGGRFISWRSFSGTERAIAFCALSVGLAAKSPVKLAILDEVTRLDFANKAKLFNALDGLVKSGALDQAIIVDTDVPYWRNITCEAGAGRCALVVVK